MRTDLSGRGPISVLAADRLVLEPHLYSTFLLWLLSELFEKLPEVGDLERPKLVFLFDEAHLLFDQASAPFRQRVEQVVRLIRSKGVGVYFCSQFPDDVPGEILGQLGNRVQHALHAYTPRDQKAVRTAAETFPPNPRLDVASVIAELGVGEALVSTLQDKGVPMPVERTTICPPRCRIGALTPEERAAVRSRSPIGAKYDALVDRESAYEILTRRAAATVGASAEAQQAGSRAPAPSPRTPATGSTMLDELIWGSKHRQGMVESMAKGAARTVGSQLGRQILRGVLGGMLGGSRR
jgi:DNA helicase HerA-like ATPase